MRLMNTIDEEQNAEAAGQLELAAATARERKDRTAAGTPYKAPGGNWSKFKTYSVWQVCVVWCVWQHGVGMCGGVVTEDMHAAGSSLAFMPCVEGRVPGENGRPQHVPALTPDLLWHAPSAAVHCCCCCLQRTCEIWAFALSFAWKYFLLGRKWTYKKKEGGMTPAAVSQRKKELAGG